MKILSYVQAREKLVKEMSEAQIRRTLTISGRSQEWINNIERLVEKRNTASDIDIIEQSGMGREILRIVPQLEWVYLMNTSLAKSDSLVLREAIVSSGKIFSPALSQWLLAQEIGTTYLLSDKDFTNEEASIMRLLWENQESVCEREDVAVAVWGSEWSNKYSDWGIDALISRLRKKLTGNWHIITIKGRGYMLASKNKPSSAPQLALSRGSLVQEIVGSIYPSDEYIAYMNDQTRVRKVYKDLFSSVQKEQVVKRANNVQRILCVNSYSYDNVDSIIEFTKENKWKGVKVYFVHYDPRAIEMHSARIKELGAESYIESLYDDIRESKMRDGIFDLVINDFRLNFNQNDFQNKSTMCHVNRILKENGVALISTVVDGKYENSRYGIDQEKAPINASKPGMFQADELLVRRCWSVPYYRQLFEKSGFKSPLEFDVAGGRKWGTDSVSLAGNPWQGPYYRRWYLNK